MRIKKLFELLTASVISLSSLLVITLPVAHAVGLSCEWTGTTDNNFNTATNWTNCGGGVPGNDDYLIFPNDGGVNPGTLNNNLGPGVSFTGIQFTGAGVNSYTITGDAITLTGGITDNSSVAGVSNWIDLAITFSGGPFTIAVATKGVNLTLGGTTNDIGGTSNLQKQGPGTLVLMSNNPNWTGFLSSTSGTVLAMAPNALGASPTDANFANGADLQIFSCSDMTFNGHFTMTGDSSLITGDYPNAKLTTYGCSLGGLADEIYGYDSDTTNLTLAGSINLGSDVTFAGTNGTTTITGDLLGAYSINMLPGYTGKLVISSTNNASNTPNGTYNSAQFTKTISDSNANSVEIFKNNSITIDGTRGATTVHNGGWLLGTGTVGTLGVEAGGNVGPGHSPGCVNSGNLTLAGNFQAQIGGADPCTGYDQINVTGTVDVTGGTLLSTLYNGYVPTAGQRFTIINNDGSDAVTGTFAGVAQGGTVTGDGVTYVVSYVGGDGNDVTLTVQSIDPTKLPGTPNTGLSLLMSNPLVTLLVTLTTAGALVYLARRQQFTK